MVKSTTSESLAKRLGKNIAAQRKLLGLTQSALAEKMLLEPESISRFERGATLPSLATLHHLSASLKTTVADLLSEYPGTAYSEDRKLAKLLSGLELEDRKEVVMIVEKLSGLLKKPRNRLVD